MSCRDFYWPDLAGDTRPQSQSGTKFVDRLVSDGPRYLQLNRHLCGAVLFSTFAGLFESHLEPPLCRAVLMHEGWRFISREIV
jgi:hypothetical protein